MTVPHVVVTHVPQLMFAAWCLIGVYLFWKP
jgi:hypothetical protein